VLVALFGGCGGDDEPAATTKAPELTVPETSTQATETTSTETTPSTAPSTTTTPSTATTTQPSTQPDPDTPEGRFDKFCRENPGACG
jgi:hypothetical protein